MVALFALASVTIWAYAAAPDMDGAIVAIATPDSTPSPTIAVTPAPTPGAPLALRPLPTPQSSPVRGPVDVYLAVDPEAVFARQLTKVWCAPAGLQIVLAILGHEDTSDGLQSEIALRISEWQTWDDNHGVGWGPTSIVKALAAYGAVGYEERVYDTREDALRAATVALLETESPVVLLAWRGAHVWVMTGYRADADPRVFPDASITGTYILDPWYPRNSSIWGPSDPPGTFQDSAEMVRNFLPIKRPEGRYLTRDGRFVVLIPTVGPAHDTALPAVAGGSVLGVAPFGLR
jgi:hypothetical protein